MTEEQRTEAYVRTVREKQASMYRVACSILHHSSDAEDAVAAAMESVWRHLPWIRNMEALPAYLMRSTVNACRRQMSKKSREIVTDRMETYMEGKRDETSVGEILDGLPEKYRLPLMMHYGENMTAEEIAGALGWRRGTVSSRMSRGLEILRKQMAKEETDYDR